jgi:4-hydroxybenzoate polyprenyltransferase
LGVPRALVMARVCHACTAIFLVALYFVASPHLQSIYLGGVVLVIGLLAYEHRLVRPDDLGRVNQAFFQVNAVISIGLFLLVLVQLAVKW